MNHIKEHTEYEEYVRPPIEPIKTRMICEEDDFEEFKNKIMEDDTIDIEIKNIMISSRKEYIDNHKKKITFNNLIAERSSIFTSFLIKLNQMVPDNSCISENQSMIENRINKYVEGKLENIILEFEIFYEVICIIELLEITLDKKEKLSKVFQVKDVVEYNDYKMIIELSKKDYQELENKKKLNDEEKNNRKNLLDNLLKELKRFSLLDTKIMSLKETLEPSFIKFISLESNYIQIMSEDILNELKKFIRNSRTCKNKYDEIIIFCII